MCRNSLQFAFLALTILVTMPVTSAQKSELFEQLVRRRWGHARNFVELRRDGTFQWYRASDYVERNDRGKWTLVTAGKNRGLIHAEHSGDIPVKLGAEGGLYFGGILFEAGKLIAYSAPEKQRTVDQLPTVKPTDTFRRLTSTQWIKTNDFDDYMSPDRIIFLPNGNYTARFRNGQCQATGQWGLTSIGGASFGFSSRQIQFVTKADPNVCDQRGNETAEFSNGPLNWSGEFLILNLNQLYAAEAKRPASRVFRINQYADSLIARGEYKGSLQAGKPVELTLNFEGSRNESFTIQSVTIEAQPINGSPTSWKNGFQTGNMKTVLDENLDIVLPPRKRFQKKVTIVPPFSGHVYLSVRLTYQGSTQPYASHTGFMTTVAEEE